MNYPYVSSRVRALENSLLGTDTLRSLASSSNVGECIGILNSTGFEGENAQEVISKMKSRKAELINELIDDKSELEVLFYPQTFHNIKAAAKKLYTKNNVSDMFYEDALISGEVLMRAMESKEYESLPEYIREGTQKTYSVLLRTGDSQLCDMTADKACLEAMKAFGEKTKYDILKKYVNEMIAAADIKTVLRVGKDIERIEEYIVPCLYFSSEAIIKAAKADEFDAFLSSTGIIGINADNADDICERRIAYILGTQKYNICTPAPAINFIFEYERMIKLIRYILVCKANGVSDEKIKERVNAYV